MRYLGEYAEISLTPVLSLSPCLVVAFGGGAPDLPQSRRHPIRSILISTSPPPPLCFSSYFSFSFSSFSQLPISTFISPRQTLYKSPLTLSLVVAHSGRFPNCTLLAPPRIHGIYLCFTTFSAAQSNSRSYLPLHLHHTLRSYPAHHQTNPNIRHSHKLPVIR